MVPLGRAQRLLGFGFVVVALLAVQVPLASAQPMPITLTGWNADVITDADMTVRFAQSFDGGRIAWFEAGAVDDGGTAHLDGLPAGSTFTSATGSGAVYAILPANGYNCLRVWQFDEGKLSLVTPAAYTTLGIIASSGSGGGTGTVTVTYNSGPPDMFSYNRFDWCDNGAHPEAAITGLGRAGSIGLGSGFSYLSECGFGIYETIIAPDPTRNVVTLTFDNIDPGHATFTGIFGVSGQ